MRARRRHAVTMLVLLVLTAPTACSARAPVVEVDRIVEVLDLGAGARVADVGAGEGEWTVALAELVGDLGHVYSTEVKPDLVDEIGERADDAGLHNVSVFLGGDEQTGLPPGCCDAILLRQVYHHFTDPVAMRADLREALRPGGALLVIEIKIQRGWEELDGVPDRGGHGIEPGDLLAEMTGDRFELVARYDSWPGDLDRYAMLFRPVP